MSDEQALVPFPVEPERTAIVRAPEVILSEAQQAAKALTDVIKGKKNPVKFNNEIYLENEDWQTVGRFYGYTAKAEDAEPVEVDGVKGAKASALLLDRDGNVVSKAVAYCMRDERNWKHKPWFQLASMAQTRASSKAYRTVLSWVVVLAGYKPTPAEEMEGVYSEPEETPPASGDAGQGEKPLPEAPPATLPTGSEEKNKYMADLGSLCDYYADLLEQEGFDRGDALQLFTKSDDGKFKGYKDITKMKHEWQFKKAIEKATEAVEQLKRMTDEDGIL